MMMPPWKNTAKTHTGNFTLQRYKGLGEMDAEQLVGDDTGSGTQDLEKGRDRGWTYGVRCDRNADGK